MTNQIWVPRKVAGEEFYAEKVDEALRNCQTPTKEAPQGYEAQFMPEIIDTRITSPKEARIWQTWFTAPSIRATGRSRQGKPFVVYAHIPNYFSKHENLTKAIEQGLVNGAGGMPQDEFQRLLDLKDDERVFVVDYEKLRSAESGVIPVSKALAHPQTIPFLGGRERAEAYLPQHEKNYGNTIGNWHSNDLIEDSPLARALFVGVDCYYGGFYGGYDLGNDARFLGVRAEGAAQNFSPSANQLTGLINEYVAPVNQQEVHERISALFR